jgi:hypothetical protein
VAYAQRTGPKRPQSSSGFIHGNKMDLIIEKQIKMIKRAAEEKEN